jgi:UDP-N-acetylmuramate dehydrogenase
MPEIQKNIPLRNYSNFKIGGTANYFATAKNILELEQILKEAPAYSENIFFLGGGTNILFSDKAFNGLVVKVDIEGIEKEGNLVRVGAGVSIQDLLSFCIDNSLSGLEWAGGLPGTVGGAVRGNAGAYQGEMKDCIIEVESMVVGSAQIKKRKIEECNFAYRNSIYKETLIGKEAITFVTFGLQTGNSEEIRTQIEDKVAKRKMRHPLEYPNLGSIFQNVPVEKFSQEKIQELSQYVKNDPFPVIPTAKLNFLAGLSGHKVGDAQLSEKHTNFIINLGQASSSDVKTLIANIKKAINGKFGVELSEEIMIMD